MLGQTDICIRFFPVLSICYPFYTHLYPDIHVSLDPINTFWKNSFEYNQSVPKNFKNYFDNGDKKDNYQSHEIVDKKTTNNKGHLHSFWSNVFSARLTQNVQSSLVLHRQTKESKEVSLV